MAESFVSNAARIFRVGNELSGANQKMKDAIHSFLLWFCPLVDGEKLPIDHWSVYRYGNGAWGLNFHYEGKRYEVRSDGFKCHIKHYHPFCVVLTESRELLIEWMQKLVIQRQQAILMLEQIPDVVYYKPARSRNPIEVGRTDCDLVVFRSHPDFPNTLAPEVEGVWSGTNPAWPDATVDLILEQLDPPCHTNWKDFVKGGLEQRNGLVATVVYVRPGPKSTQASPRSFQTVSD